jgi:hypothetical protein
MKRDLRREKNKDSLCVKRSGKSDRCQTTYYEALLYVLYRTEYC